LDSLIPKERIAYYHSRNLNYDYNEHEESLSEEKEWVGRYETNKVLWEPKLIKKKEILELIK
jgi:hypothetical protein